MSSKRVHRPAGTLSRDVEPDRDREFTSTLAAGMALLSAFRAGDDMLANRDFVARTGLTKANVSRLAFTLVALGFLRRDAASGRYRLGSPVLSMGYPLLAGMHVRQIARPYMREMADELGATVSMGVRDRAQMIYVETSRNDDIAARPADIGTAVPLLASAMGLAWLVTASSYERDRAMNQALVFAGRRRDDEALRPFRNAAKHFAASGYVSFNDPADGSTTVATPMRSSVQGDIIVLDCLGASPKSRAASGVAEIGQRLVLTVRAIEGAMSLPMPIV